MGKVRRYGPFRGQVVLLLLALLLLLGAVQAHRWYRDRLLDQQRSQLEGDLVRVHNALAPAVERRLDFAQSVEARLRQAPTLDLAQAALTELVAEAASLDLGLSRALVVPAAEAGPLFEEGDWQWQPGPLPDSGIPLTVERAIVAGRFLLGSPLGAEGQQGIPLYRVFTPDQGTEPLALNLVFDLRQLLAEAGLGVGGDPFDLFIFDHKSAPVYGAPALFEQNPSLFYVAIADGGWNLVGVPPGGWAAAVRPDLLLFDSLLAAIILLTLGVAALTVNRQERLQAAVAARTRELQEANAELQAAQATLEQRVAERTQTLRRRADQFEAISEIGQRIGNLMDLDELLAQTVRLIHETFGYYRVGVGLVEGDEVVYRFGAGVHWPQPTSSFGPLRLKIGKEGLSGSVAATGEALLIRDVRQEPSYPQMAGSETRSELALPILIQGDVVGVLDIMSRRPDAFDDTDQVVLQVLAEQIGVAIQNARLYSQAQAVAALEERQKLARELHDSVSQALYGIGLGANTALALMERETATAGQLAGPLSYIRSLAQTAQAEMRALIFELRPESLEVEGLLPALARRVEAMRARGELEIVLEADEEPALPVRSKEALYRVAQEALHNVRKHAEAGRVEVRLAQENGDLLLEIADDGRGFQMQDHFPGHLGLQSMRERLEAVGGRLTIESAPGEGTRVRARLPLAEG